MMDGMENEWHVIGESSSPEETHEIGKQLAAELRSGDVVLLTGDLGAGKTQLVQGAACGLGANEVPISPTFNIVLTYSSGRLPIHHFDLYRLDTREQLEDIGLREYLESGGVCFVEWAEKFPDAFDDYIAIDIEKVSDTRRVIRARRSGRAERVSDGGAPLRMEEPPCDVLVSGETAGCNSEGPNVLAVDTSNEVVAIGVGTLIAEARRVEVVATREIPAHRASNTTLVPAIDALLRELGIARGQIACVCVGRGPGSFTGVRIAMACAKGIASALGVGLVGVSTLDAVAWNVWDGGVRGDLIVLADAMRKEVYPARFELADTGARRLSADRVVKADAFAAELGEAGDMGKGNVPVDEAAHPRPLIAGDALVKYRELYEGAGVVLSDKLWEVTGRGLLLAFQAAWAAGEIDPFDAVRHDPAFPLPVYTRLSDAEENERARLAQNNEKDLVSGVQGRETMHSQARLAAPAGADGVSYHPLDAAHVAEVAALEGVAMGTDAWSERLVADELGQRNRSWWVAEADGILVAYAGGLVVDGELEILKVAVKPEWRRRGIATELLHRVAEDARNLGACTCSLEVRASNADAQALYSALGFEPLGIRPRYYSDREDALIMRGPLPASSRDVAGMELQHLGSILGSSSAGGGCAALGSSSEGGGSVQKLRSLRSAPSLRAGDGDGGSVQKLRSLHSAPSLRAGDGAEGSVQELRSLRSAPSLRAGDGAEGSVQELRSLRSAPSLRAEGGGLAGPHVGESRMGFARPLILAIESSCDETAAAVVDGTGELRSDVVASQIDFHARFGGVVPEIASRKHIEAICGVCEEALAMAGARWCDLDSVAVTYAPGLLGALVVGVAFAKGAAWALDVPFIGVNHLEGHLYANKIGAPGFAPPAVVSLVSGGNTMLVHMRDWGDYEVLGSTIDDAVGEAFDKVAKALGLGYPGGPVISREAVKGDPDAIAFPRAMLHSHDLRFSLSGLKTAVVNYINNERAAGRELNIPDIAASFQQAVVDVQVAKARTALEQTGARTFCLGGGVAANPALRAAYGKLCAKMGVELVMPPLSSCGDNAGMIALVALDRFSAGRFFSLDADAQAHADLSEPY